HSTPRERLAVGEDRTANWLDLSGLDPDSVQLGLEVVARYQDPPDNDDGCTVAGPGWRLQARSARPAGPAAGRAGRGLETIESVRLSGSVVDQLTPLGRPRGKGSVGKGSQQLAVVDAENCEAGRLHARHGQQPAVITPRDRG